MTNRLQQFFDFGHNCAVLGITPTQVPEVLIDNRFNPWAITQEERERFLAGYNHRPLQWTRDTLKFITIRPIIREPFQHTHDRREYRQRASRPNSVVHSLETREKIRERTVAFWNSPNGAAMKKRLSFKKHNQHTKQKVHR